MTPFYAAGFFLVVYWIFVFASPSPFGDGKVDVDEALERAWEKNR